MSTSLAVRPMSPEHAPLAEAIEQALIGGDLAKLTPAQRVTYYKRVCESLGLNPLTKPFAYITLNGKLVLYALKDCTEQLRKLHGVSITDLTSQRLEDVFVVTAKALDKTGRIDAATGAVPIGNAKGEALANLLMKAETKAKRRATLSICGLGMLDETELDTIPGATAHIGYSVEAPVEAVAASPGPASRQPSKPNGGDSDSRPSGAEVLPDAALSGDSIPNGAVLISKVEAGWQKGKAKGFIHHSGQLPGSDGLPVFDERLVTLATECCQDRTPVLVDLKISAASQKPYIKGIRRAAVQPVAHSELEPPPLDDEIPF